MKSLLMFIGGIVVGAGVTYIYQKNRYEEMIQEEIESLREHTKEKETKIKENESEENITEFVKSDLDEEIKKAENYENYYDETISKVHNLVRENNYISSEEQENEIANKFKKPFLLTPEEFGSIPGFDADTYYYHHDDIISNDNQEIVDDVQQILGMSEIEIKEHFGDYEDDPDAVYIRNMRLKCDFEILREEENFVKRNGD